MKHVPKPHLFCYGFGYTAKALGALLSSQGWKVDGTHRDTFHQPLPLTVTHLLISIPPDVAGDLVLQHHRAAIQNLPSLRWVGYLSTTGVYGDSKGEWVDETAPLNPPNARLVNRVLAEQQWLDTGLPVHIFRLAGIYGPGRSAFDKLIAGTARRIDKKGQFFSRIHVDDSAQVLVASIMQPHPGTVYNVADDYPCAQEEVIRYAAALLEVAPPPLISFEEAELSPMARSFYDGSRRVLNTKIKHELGVVLRFPSYREGLMAIKNHFHFG